jgi:hypothetical protein
MKQIGHILHLVIHIAEIVQMRRMEIIMSPCFSMFPVINILKAKDKE